jgi:transcriptional regulator of acetoin/glycerol metabolism
MLTDPTARSSSEASAASILQLQREHAQLPKHMMCRLMMRPEHHNEPSVQDIMCCEGGRKLQHTERAAQHTRMHSSKATNPKHTNYKHNHKHKPGFTWLTTGAPP